MNGAVCGPHPQHAIVKNKLWNGKYRKTSAASCVFGTTQKFPSTKQKIPSTKRKIPQHKNKNLRYKSLVCRKDKKNKKNKKNLGRASSCAGAGAGGRQARASTRAPWRLPGILKRQHLRPTIEAKETYYRGKRDLLYRQKRPICQAFSNIRAPVCLLCNPINPKPYKPSTP